MKSVKLILPIVILCCLLLACKSDMSMDNGNAGLDINASDDITIEEEGEDIQDEIAHETETEDGQDINSNDGEETPEFFQYLGMTFDSIEAKLGKGKPVDFPYEIGFVTYKFGDTQLLCNFDADPETNEISIDQCSSIAIRLKDMIPCGEKERISRSEMEQYFTIGNWDDNPWLDDEYAGDSPWVNVYPIWGKYFGYEFNAYPDATEENKTSMPVDTYFHFYYNSKYNDRSVNP